MGTTSGSTSSSWNFLRCFTTSRLRPSFTVRSSLSSLFGKYCTFISTRRLPSQSTSAIQSKSRSAPIVNTTSRSLNNQSSIGSSVERAFLHLCAARMVMHRFWVRSQDGLNPALSEERRRQESTPRASLLSFAWGLLLQGGACVRSEVKWSGESDAPAVAVSHHQPAFLCLQCSARERERETRAHTHTQGALLPSRFWATLPPSEALQAGRGGFDAPASL